MKVAISGSTGFIGSHLISWLSKNEFNISRLVRTKPFHDIRYPNIFWNPEKREIESHLLENQDMIIHLAGENIAKERWTKKRKEEIRKSRVDGTSFLCQTLASLTHPPKIFFSASAIGFYGNRDPEERLSEESNPGEGFLASVVKDWEKATEPLLATKTRVILMRFGLVLSPKGGALKRMLLPFKLGLGGKIGPGTQMMSWISIDEIPRIIYHTITHPELQGPINFTAPNPLSNKEFTSLLAKTLERPALFPVPAFVVKALFGEMGEELLLGGASILPRKLQESGYRFLFPDLLSALFHLLSQPY